jgi:hypothetical protein
MSKSSLLLLIIVIICTFNSKQAYCSENYQDIKQQKILPPANNSFEFIENKGQLADSNGKPTPDILFYASTPGMHIYVRQEGISFVLCKKVKNTVNTITEREAVNNMPYEQFTESSAVEYYRTDMDFAGNVVKPVVAGMEPTGAFNNYYLSQCPNGILNVRAYKGVTFENIYPDIDFVLYVNDSNQPEYDFVVKPGGNPDDIKLRIDPYESLSLTENGNIRISTPLGDVEKLKPAAFQSEGNLRSEIWSRFCNQYRWFSYL